MARAIITFRLMPEDANVPLDPIKKQAEKIAKENGAIGQMLIEEQPIAFGLKAVVVKAMYQVEGGDFDAIAQEMGKISQIQTAELAGMDLPLG